MSFTDKYLDVLQNIEFAIQLVFKEKPELTDYDVTFALEYLIEYYTSKERGREPRNFNLSENSIQISENVIQVCEYRMGHLKTDKSDIEDQPVTANEILNCLKKIKTSAVKWTKRSGRKGYLDFTKDFFPDA